jgi:YfiH family protein
MTLPKPIGEFQWTQESWGPTLRCTPLSTIAQHCFTTGQVVALARAFDVDDATPERIVRLRQVHGAAVFEASQATAARIRNPDGPEADIVVSRDPSFVLTVRAADCVPVLLADCVTGAVSAIHAGWRGTGEGAVLAGVRALSAQFGTQPANIIAAVGPAIGPCCYAVGEELVEKFRSHADASRWFDRTRGLHLNLWQATRDQLERAGVLPQNIHISELCTFDHPGVFPSYRRDGQAAGRLVAAIRAKPKP